jgi:ribosomal protein S18 acetylase RimI-like enzyme
MRYLRQFESYNKFYQKIEQTEFNRWSYLEKYQDFSDVLIRKASDDDYPSIKKIANEHRKFLPFVMRVAIEDSIKRDEVYVAEINGSVIGFMNFHKRKDGVTTVYEIGVTKDFQKLGIATKFIKKLNRPIALKVTEDNPANLFYQKLGFKKTGQTKAKNRLLNIYILE